VGGGRPDLHHLDPVAQRVGTGALSLPALADPRAKLLCRSRNSIGHCACTVGVPSAPEFQGDESRD
jgi:hypothetical protein